MSETDNTTVGAVDIPDKSHCRLCDEPLKATEATSAASGVPRLKAFAITPAGFSGPLIFTAEHGRSTCGLTTTHGGIRLRIGLNLILKDGHILQDIAGGLTAEQWDQLMGELLLMAQEVDQKLPWFESLLRHTYPAIMGDAVKASSTPAPAGESTGP
jgi:hypothetical protein